MANTLSFFLNGQQVTIDRPSVHTLLIDYLRSPEVHLSGPKKPCAQGGCGGCTVILSEWNAAEKKAEHRAINSCLRPLLAVEGMVVTTVEGTGAARPANAPYLTHTPISSRGGVSAEDPLIPSVLLAYRESQEKRAAVFSAIEKAPVLNLTKAPLKMEKKVATHPFELTHMGINPVAQRLAINNGTQCGYCTVGFVMNMSEFILNNPNATQREIEDIFDGNICRCTGYRPILTGMKTFASNWTQKDEDNRMKCLGDDGVNSQLPASSIVIPFPELAQAAPHGVSVDDRSGTWLSPATLTELGEAFKSNRDKKPHLLHSNTSFGIYPKEYYDSSVLIDIRHIPELHAAAVVSNDEIIVSAGTSYSDLIGIIEKALKAHPAIVPSSNRDPETTCWGAALFMARRTAGRIVRNAATLGGNAMLVFKHIAKGTGEPFPSDLLTALAAIDARIDYIDLLTGRPDQQPTSVSVSELCVLVQTDPGMVDRILLLAFHLPSGPSRSLALAQKVALRDVNAHSIVNAGSRIQMDDRGLVKEATLYFGGLAPYPWAATNTAAQMKGKKLSVDLASQLFSFLSKEIDKVFKDNEARMEGLPDEGFTHEYKKQLACSFLYKAVISGMIQSGEDVPAEIRSAGEITWGRWPVSSGKQTYSSQAFKAPVSQPYIKFTAMEQASGQLHYTHELPVPVGTVNGSLVQSKKALANFCFTIPGTTGPTDTHTLRLHLSDKFPYFTDIVTSEAFKDGGINLMGMGSDQPVFAIEQVDYVGQAIALACADTEQHAALIAGYIGDNCVGYSDVEKPAGKPDWWGKPLLGLEDAIRLGSIYPDYPSAAPFNSHIWKIIRPGSQLEWVDESKDPLDRKITNINHTLDGNLCAVLTGTQLTGGQVHFYMETQAAIAEPVDGGRYVVRCSSQSPMGMHTTVAMALGIQYNNVDVRIPPVGGGFGGKTEQAKFVTAAAAVAAKALKRPVRLVLSREQDTAMIGKRHPYYSQHQVAIDRGLTVPANKGILRGLSFKMWGDGGAFYDCSFVVSNCIITRGDNAYQINNSLAQIDVCRTNTSPSTAMRAFGDVQGKVMLENAIEDAAFAVGMTAEAVREKNLYRRGDVTPFGQALTYCYMREVWDLLKKNCAYDDRLKAVKEFNSKNKWRKRGLSMIPVKYGSGYNLTMLEQTGAFVAVYQGDGSIIIHQGGVEMGQGLLTEVRQVASYILNIPMALVEVESVRTGIIPNPTSTGASTGTCYSAEAVKRVCGQLRSILVDFGNDMLKQHGNDWCVAQGIDFWNHPEGWQAAPTAPHRKPLIWQNLVALAYQNRVNLTVSLTGPIVGGETVTPNLTYKPFDEQPEIPGYKSVQASPGAFNAFSGFTYSAACSEVEVDILTGETKILRSDIMYDMGWSMNPAIDIGQVEGAFVQGIGYVLSEKLVYEPAGPDLGRLNTLNTWTYKPPATTTIPLELNVELFPRDSVPYVPENPSDIMSAKEVGEPPLVLAVTVFFAVKSAVRAARLEQGLVGLFPLDAPATVQDVRMACVGTQ